MSASVPCIFPPLVWGKEYSDMTILCDDEVHIPAHKYVVCQRVASIGRELECDENPNPLVDLTGYDSQIVKMMLAAVYHGTGRLNFEESLRTQLMLDFYGVRPVQSSTRNFIYQQLKDCIDLYGIAVGLGIRELQDAMSLMIRQIMIHRQESVRPCYDKLLARVYTKSGDMKLKEIFHNHAPDELKKRYQDDKESALLASMLDASAYAKEQLFGLTNSKEARGCKRPAQSFTTTLAFRPKRAKVESDE